MVVIVVGLGTGILLLRSIILLKWVKRAERKAI